MKVALQAATITIVGAMLSLGACTKTETTPSPATDTLDTTLEAVLPEKPTSNTLHFNTIVIRNAGSKTFTLQWATNDSTLHNHPRIVGLGSSTLAGYHLEYPNRLGDKIIDWLSKNTTKPYWVNKAAYGLNSASILPNENGGTPGANISAALFLQPQIIFVSLPSNDAANSIPVTQTLAHFRTIDSLALLNGAITFFETSQPRNSPNINVQNALKALADSIRKVWPERFVEGFKPVVNKDTSAPATIMPKYNLGDGIHLTSQGNQLIADNLFKAWLNYFKPIQGVARYIIETSTDKTSWRSFDVVRNGNVVSKTYPVTDNATHYYRIRAVYNNGRFSPFNRFTF